VKRAATVLCLLICASCSLADNPVTIYIKWSTKHTHRRQDWSGHAETSQGRVIKAKNDSGSMDKIAPDQSSTIIYNRGNITDPKKRINPKGLWLTVDADKDAVVTVKTNGGDFSFRLDEVKKEGLERLDGNVKIYPERPGGRRRRRRRPQLPPAKVLGEIGAERISDPKRQSEWAAITNAEDGTLWAAYIEWDGSQSDRVLVRRKAKGETWGQPVALDDGLWDHYWPAVAAIGNSALVVWSSQKDGNFDLFCSTVSADGKASRPEQLTNAPHTDFHARLCATPNGDVPMVWQSFRAGQSDVYARWFRAGKWGDEVRVSPSESHDWQPAVAMDRQGTAWIVWDGYHTGNYDVFLRRLDQQDLGPVVPVTTEPTAQLHSSVTVDHANRVWIAWDEAEANWGKDLSTSSAAPGSKGLHYSRTIRMRVFDGQKLSDPAAKVATIFTGRMSRYAELPHLTVDGVGTLWLVFRHWTISKPTEMYHEYVAKLTKDGWVGPWQLASSAGRNTQWADAAIGPDGTAQVAYASDLRAPDNLPKDQARALTYGVYIASLPRGDGMPPLALAEAKLPPPAKRPSLPSRATMAVAGKSYTLVMGDCHRHTDIRGHSAVDGSIHDTYRYALDCVPLDYLGMGDHNEVFGGKWPDGLRDYQWWWTQKAADLFNCPPTFVALYSYEHSLSTPAGHRNIIFLKRGAPLRMVNRGDGRDAPANQPPELWKWIRENVHSQSDQKCVIVPHTFAAGPLAEWNWPNAPFDCLLEIYQGARGSYEAWNLPKGEKRGRTQTKKKGHFARDALAKGYRYGFVSFIDHRSTHNSFAAIWAQDISRQSIIEGMLARRTYAATDQIVMKVSADDRLPGEEFDAPAARPPTIRINALAPDTILRADIVKNGEHIWTRQPNERVLKMEFLDTDAKPGDSYYYVRLFQRDPDKPDGDPECAWVSPFFVRYR